MNKNILRLSPRKFAIIYIFLIIYFIFLFQPQKDIAEWTYDMACSTFLLSKSVQLNLSVEKIFQKYFGQYADTPGLYQVLEYNLINFIFQSSLSATFYLFFSYFGIDLISSQIILYFFIWLLTFIIAYLLGRALFNKAFGLVFACLFSTLPYFNIIMRSGWIQVAIVPMSAMLGPLLIFDTHNAKRSSGTKWLCYVYILILSVIMTTKYTGTVFSPILYGGTAVFAIISVKLFERIFAGKRQFSDTADYRLRKWYYYVSAVIFIALFIQGFLYFYQLHFTTDIGANIKSIFQLAMGRKGPPSDTPLFYKLVNTFRSLFYQDYSETELTSAHEQTWYFYKPLIPLWYSVFIIFGILSTLNKLRKSERPIENLFPLLAAGISLFLGVRYQNVSGRSSIAYLPWLILLSARGIFFLFENIRIWPFKNKRNIPVIALAIIVSAASIFDFNYIFVRQRDEQQYIWSGIKDVKDFLDDYKNYYLICYSNRLGIPALFYLADFSDNFTEGQEIDESWDRHDYEKYLDSLREKYDNVFILISTNFNFIKNPGPAQKFFYPRGPETFLYDHMDNLLFFEKEPVKTIYNRTGFPKFYIYKPAIDYITMKSADSSLDIALDNIQKIEIKGNINKIIFENKDDKKEIVFPPGNLFHYIQFNRSSINGEVIYPMDFSENILPKNIILSEDVKHSKILEESFIFGAIYLTAGGFGSIRRGHAFFDYKIDNADITGFETFNLFNIFNDFQKETSITYSYSVNGDNDFQRLAKIKSDGSRKYSLFRCIFTGDSLAETKRELRELLGWFQICQYSRIFFDNPVKKITFLYKFKAFRSYHTQINSIINRNKMIFTYNKLFYISDISQKYRKLTIISNNSPIKVKILHNNLSKMILNRAKTRTSALAKILKNSIKTYAKL